MTEKTRQQIERILTGAAVAARQVVGSKVCGAFSMDTTDTIYFVTVGGDKTGITPRQLGAAIAKVGNRLQGREDDDAAHVEMVRKGTNGQTEPLPLDDELGAHSADRAKPADEGTITGEQIVALLKLAEQVGRNLGKTLAYRDVLGVAEKRLHEQEEILKTAKAGEDAAAMCMGEIMALRCLLSDFDGAIDHFTNEGGDAMATLARYVVDENLSGVEQAAEALKAAGLV